MSLSTQTKYAGPLQIRAYRAGSNRARSVLGLTPLHLGAALVGGVLGAGLALPSSGKKQIKSEVHDPRLYSNLRGMLTLESAKERIDAHKKLPKHKGMSVFEAMRSGATRTKEAVSYKWVNDKVTDAMRKGVTPERLETFSNNVLDTARRAHGPQRVESVFSSANGATRRKLLERVSSKATQADMHGWDMHAAYPGGVGMPANPELRPAIEDLITQDSARIHKERAREAARLAAQEARRPVIKDPAIIAAEAQAEREARRPVIKDPAIIAAEAQAEREARRAEQLAVQAARNPVHKDPAVIAAEEQAAREARQANKPVPGGGRSRPSTPTSPYTVPALAAAGLAIPAMAYAVSRDDPKPYAPTP